MSDRRSWWCSTGGAGESGHAGCSELEKVRFGSASKTARMTERTRRRRKTTNRVRMMCQLSKNEKCASVDETPAVRASISGAILLQPDREISLCRCGLNSSRGAPAPPILSPLESVNGRTISQADKHGCQLIGFHRSFNQNQRPIVGMHKLVGGTPVTATRKLVARKFLDRLAFLLAGVPSELHSVRAHQKLTPGYR